MQYKLGIIGVGVMAGALLDRTLYNLYNINLAADEILIYDKDRDKMKSFHKRGVTVASSPNEVFESAETVLLGVKPQFYADILSKTSFVASKNIISIMAGVKIATLREALGDKIGIARVMPNTPCQVGKGTMALCFDKVEPKYCDFITEILKNSGEVIPLEESKFDAATSICGSGPAYVYLFAAGLIKGGLAGGLSYAESRAMALKTIEGAAALAAKSDVELDTLVDRVCSKGGTTIEAVEVFKTKDFENIIAEAVSACRVKSKELSDKY